MQSVSSRSAAVAIHPALRSADKLSIPATISALCYTATALVVRINASCILLLLQLKVNLDLYLYIWRRFIVLESSYVIWVYDIRNVFAVF